MAWPFDSYLLAPQPQSFFSLYDDNGTVSSVDDLIASWGLAEQPDADARPLQTSDSVTGASVIVRADIGKTLSIPAGVLDVLAHTGGTIYIVFRQRAVSPTFPFTLFDSTAGGTQKGVQLRVDSARVLRFRVFDGSTWVIDHTGESAASYQPLKWSVASIAYNANGAVLSVDNAQPYYTDTFSVTMPTGTIGALVIGDSVVDFAALEVFTEVHNRSEVVSNTSRLGSRFSAPLVATVAFDGVRNFSFPSVCRLTNGTYLGIYRDGLGHATNDGIGIAANSANFRAWSNYRTIVSFAATNNRGLHDPNICAHPFLDGSIWVNYFEDAPDIGQHLNRLMVTTSTDGGTTWSTPTRITNGMGYNLEVASAPIVEAYGQKYLPVYNGTDESGVTPWNAEAYISDDDFATMTTVRVGSGSQVGSPGFSEWGILDIGGGIMFALLRTELDMYEAWSSDEGATWSTPVATGMNAHSAARIYHDAIRHKIYWLGRPNAILRSTLFERSTDVEGTGEWNVLPAAITINASMGTCIYGAIVPGTALDTLAIISGSQIGATVDDTNAAIYAQEIAEFIPNGDMPIVITPSSSPTLNPGDTIDFTAIGAGNFTWSLHTNATGGSINSSSGHYVVGSAGGTDVIWGTDLNGAHAAVSVTANAAPSTLPDTANLTFHYDPSVVGEVTASGGLASSVANENGTSSALTGSAPNKPAYGSSTLNSLNTLDFSAGKIMSVTLPGVGVANFSDLTFAAVFKTGSSIAGTQALGGNASGGIVCRIDDGVLRVIDYTAGPVVTVFTDLTVTTNTAHVAVFRRTGNSYEAWLDGVKSSVTGTLTSNDIPVAWPIANDDPATLFGEQFLGYIGELAMWKVAESDGNVTTAMSSLKAKWGTT